MKIKSKVSGQFIALRGAQNFVKLRLVIDTLTEQSLETLPSLQHIALSGVVTPDLLIVSLGL